MLCWLGLPARENRENFDRFRANCGSAMVAVELLVLGWEGEFGLALAGPAEDGGCGQRRRLRWPPRIWPVRTSPRAACFWMPAELVFPRAMLCCANVGGE